MMTCKKLLTALLLSCGFIATAETDLFQAASEKDLPLEVKILEEKNEGTQKFQRFFFTSQQENGDTFRIYAVYAAPAQAGKCPVLLHLHGGGQTADPALVKRWAARGYACLSFDWTGNMDKKIAGKREFSRLGKMTERSNNDSMFPEKIEDSRVRHIQIAARRALLWLKKQPETDLERLGVIGLSWGGFSSLLLAETLPEVKAVTDIYGGGFFTGAYQLTGPLIYRSPEVRKAWLEAYDPGRRLAQLKAPVLMLTGLNDIFVPLKQFLRIYQELPGSRHLVLIPNNNHALTWDFIDSQAQIWFDHYLKGQTANLPEIAAVTATPKTVKGRIELNGQTLKSVTVNFTWCKGPLQTETKSRWQNRTAELLKNNFLAELPQLAPDREHPWLNYCVNAVTSSGAMVSTPVTAVKIDAIAAAPTAADNTAIDANNFFADPSLEKQRGRGFTGKVYFNFTGEYVYDDSGDKARTGKAAVRLSGKNQLIMEAKGITPGTTYILSGWFKGAENASNANLRINWMKSGKFVKTALILGKAGADAYQQLTLKADAPEGTTSAILFFNAADAWVDDLSFAPAPGK